MKQEALTSERTWQARARDAAADVPCSSLSAAADLFAGPVGYLTNVYPSVSHSFIRREILALEKRGITIDRFSVRRCDGPLPDLNDQRERQHTAVLLDGRIVGLLVATLRLAVARPRCFSRAFGMMREMKRAAGRGGLRHLAYLAEAALLVQIAQRRGIRHLHVHFGTNPAAVARLAKALGGPSYSMTLHGPDEFDAPLALSLPRKIADASFVIAISSYGRGQVMRWCTNADWKKLAVVRCGLDRQFLELAPDLSTARPPHTLVCIARLDPQKGLSLLLDAVALVAPTRQLEVRIIGDGPMRKELADRIAQLRLGGIVCLLGWKSAAAIRNELLAARALILPSFAEGLPVVLMEALALERPVIATAVAGVPELVDASCGWLVPAGSAHALAGAMVAALDASTQELQARGKAGHAIVRARHDARTNAAQLATLLSAAWHGRAVELVDAA